MAHSTQKQEKLIQRDRYIDKVNFEDRDQNGYQSQEHLEEAISFFDQLNLPNIIGDFEKIKCPKCNHPKKTYCLKCGELLLTEEQRNQLPQILLPFELRVLHHEKEKHQKSSALPVQFLSQQAKMNEFPKDTLLFGEHDYILYPHQNAKLLQELPLQELLSINSILAIDCTWRQTNQIISQLESQPGERKYIKLGEYKTFFWRYQHHSGKCLATVEAIYYFYQEWNKYSKNNTNFDTLLYFYAMNFNQIRQSLTSINIYEKTQQKKDRRLNQKIQHKIKQSVQNALTKIVK